MSRNGKKRIRLTPFGYLVFAAGFAVLMFLGYILIRALGGASIAPTGGVTGSGNPLGGGTPEPSKLESIFSAASAATNEPVMKTSVPMTTKGPTPTISLATPYYPEGVPTPTPTPVLVSRTPTPEEEMGAVEGRLRTSGVNLRAGPSTNDKILGTGFSKGTKLKVYAIENGFYYVKIIAKNLHGYIAVQFVEAEGITPVPIETVVPTGAIGGFVNATSAMLRNGPSKEYSGVRELPRDTMLYVFFITDNWYYLQVAATGETGYIRSDLVAVEKEAPPGTPVPR